MVGRRHSTETYHDQNHRILAAVLSPGGAVIPQHSIWDSKDVRHGETRNISKGSQAVLLTWMTFR